jgi:hypothetical protein
VNFRNVGNAKWEHFALWGRKGISEEKLFASPRVAPRVHALRHNRTPQNTTSPSRGLADMFRIAGPQMAWEPHSIRVLA